MKASKRKARTRAKSKPPQVRRAAMRPPSAHPESARPAPTPRVMVADVAAVGEPMFSALEEAFFAAGTELSAVSVAPLETFADLDPARPEPPSLWRRLFASGAFGFAS